MARTAAELVAALDSGEPSRVLRTPEGWYTTQVLDFCKELWGVDPMAQDPGVQATIAALPHPSHWEDEAAVRATIAQWLSVLSVATTQFSRDPLSWRDRTRPPETHRDRPWINSFSSKSLPDQIPVPFTMGTETWHRSGNAGIRMVAGKDRASLAMYQLPNVRWRVASSVTLEDYGLKGLQGYGIRSPFTNAPTHLLTLDRLYSHLLYCVMDCPPPGYEPAPTATWKVIPTQNPKTRQSAVLVTWECVTSGALIDWSGEGPAGSVWVRTSNPPVAYKKYSVGDHISWKVLPPAGGWAQKEFSLKITADGVGQTHYFTLPTAQWEAVTQPVLTRADQGGVLKPTLRCTRKGYIWGGWSYGQPTGWQRGRASAEPDSNTLYEVGAEVYLTFQVSPVTPDTLLTPRSASLSVEGTPAAAQYQPALATFKGTPTETSDPSTDSLSAYLTSKTAGYLAEDMTRTLTSGWALDSQRPRGKRGDWVEANTVFMAYATRDPGAPRGVDATLTLSAGGVTSSASYKAPWATWEIHGEANATYTRFTFKALTAGKTPYLSKTFDPPLPPGFTPRFELEMSLGADHWAEVGQLGAVRYMFDGLLTQTVTTTIKLINQDGSPLGQEASATFLGQPKLSIKTPLHWMPGGVHSVQGEILADSDGIIPSQGWTRSPSNGNVIVLYYNESRQGTVATFPLTVKKGDYFIVTCTWPASQAGSAKSFAYRLGTQQWSWTS